MKKERAFVLFSAIIVISLLFLSGIIAHPLKTARKITRKAIYPTNVNVSKEYDIAIDQVLYNWKIKHPNISLFCMSTGGFGNSIITLAVAFDACIKYGLRPPTLSIENGADFDFHKLSSCKYEFKDSPSCISEFFPWVHVATTRTFLGLWAILNRPRLWKGTSLDDFPIDGNVILSVDYGRVLKISDQAFNMVTRSINPNIFEYIRRNYSIGPETMAVHLRLGQPTDDFVPKSPSASQIAVFHTQFKPERTLVFSDNREKALQIMSATNIAYEIVSDVNYIECILMSLCKYAIISESTFAVSACRLGNLKHVSLPKSKNQGYKQDETWLDYE